MSLSKADRCREMKKFLDKCDHVIRVPGYTFDIGVFKVNDTYQLSYDWVGDIANVLGKPQDYCDKWGIENVVNPLPQAYALQTIKNRAAELGWVWEQNIKDSDIYLEITQYD